MLCRLGAKKYDQLFRFKYIPVREEEKVEMWCRLIGNDAYWKHHRLCATRSILYSPICQAEAGGARPRAREG